MHIVLESSLSFLGKRKCWWLHVIIKVTSGHYQLHFPSKVKIYENSLQFRPLISIFSIYTIPVYNKKFLYAILFIFILFAVIIHWWLNWNHRSLPSGVDGDHSAVCATTTEIKALFLKQFKRSVSLVFFLSVVSADQTYLLTIRWRKNVKFLQMSGRNGRATTRSLTFHKNVTRAREWNQVNVAVETNRRQRRIEFKISFIDGTVCNHHFESEYSNLKGFKRVRTGTKTFYWPGVSALLPI